MLIIDPKPNKSYWSEHCYSNQFSDAVIKVDSEVIQVHKWILGSSSPVFKAMLQSGMI